MLKSRARNQQARLLIRYRLSSKTIGPFINLGVRQLALGDQRSALLLLSQGTLERCDAAGAGYFLSKAIRLPFNSGWNPNWGATVATSCHGKFLGSNTHSKPNRRVRFVRAD
jgi:hypothetical protein